MNIKPRTQDDFKWINLNEKHLEKIAERLIEKRKSDFNIIKSIPKDDRTFENTVYALEIAGKLDDVPEEIFAFFVELSPKKKEREKAFVLQQKLSHAMIELAYDKSLYDALLEYNPKKEKLNEPQKRLLNDALKSFKDMGFHLTTEDQKKLKDYHKKISTLSEKFQKNINDFSTFILCTKEELEGLPENYIANLAKDSKTGKYRIQYSYPTYGPFMQFAKSEKKRKEFADKVSQKGGKKNIELLKNIFDLRHKIANILGYNNYVDYITKDRLVKNQKNVLSFLEKDIKKLKPRYLKHLEKMNAFKASKTGVVDDKVFYYDSSFYSNIHTLEHHNIDAKKVKEYFEMEHVLSQMFSFFGKLFGVSFQETKQFKLWHKDVRVFNVVEKKKVIGHLALDLYPREGKYSHMGCWNFMRGHCLDDKNTNYRIAPFTIIIGNFPKGNKKHPSLLSFGEVRTMFHEFGHACHDLFTRAIFNSQAGTQVNFDFVEVPSQLFERFLDTSILFRGFTKHYKTGEKMSNDFVEQILKHKKKSFGIDIYVQYIYALLDQKFHEGNQFSDLVTYTENLELEYGLLPSSPQSLFPAGFGHLVGYAGSYYGYMYSLVLAYDFFSQFEQNGFTNKKIGQALRSVLEKGGSYDEMTYIKEFLGRKPNNKAFLKALEG